MEFPPEIVDIIRGYSKPCFKYFSEYKRMVRVKHEWPEMRFRLEINPESVLLALEAFSQSAEDYVQMSKDYHAFIHVSVLFGDMYKNMEQDYKKRVIMMRETMMKRERLLHYIVPCSIYPYRPTLF